MIPVDTARYRIRSHNSGATSQTVRALDRGTRHAASRSPEPQGAMVCDALKVVIARQHYQVVADAQLRQESIDRANLNAMTAACVADVSGFDVIGSIRHEEGKGGEPLQNLLTRFGSRKTPATAPAAPSPSSGSVHRSQSFELEQPLAERMRARHVAAQGTRRWCPRRNSPT